MLDVLVHGRLLTRLIDPFSYSSGAYTKGTLLTTKVLMADGGGTSKRFDPEPWDP